MKRSATYAKINFITIIVLIILLASLFIFPKIYLVHSMNKINDLVERTTQSVYDKDWAEAETSMSEMIKVIERCGEPLKLFLNHEDIDALQAMINGCYRLATVQDDGQILYELQGVKKKLTISCRLRHSAFSICSNDLSAFKLVKPCFEFFQHAF